MVYCSISGVSWLKYDQVVFVSSAVTWKKKNNNNNSRQLTIQEGFIHLVAGNKLFV